MLNSDILENLFCILPKITEHHNPDCELYYLLKLAARKEIERLFVSEQGETVDLRPFGEMRFPYHKMGAVDTLNLFDLDELIIFSFYRANRTRYRRVLDIGANLGLHSVILNKCGCKVECFEPDPTHFKILKTNLELNHASNVEPFNVAMSDKNGEMEFVRVLGNTTGSHLAGSKSNPYGQLERFKVETKAFRQFLAHADLVKMDVEGHEKQILLGTERDDWQNTDILVEIENKDNAAAIYEHFSNFGIGMFSQKNNWRKANNINDIPTSYKEGTLFISCRDRMPW